MSLINNPKISVVLPLYNGEQFLNQAIDSLINQTFKDFELIIVDDASTDSSLKIARSLKDKRIKILLNKANQGLSKTLNQGIKAAKASVIARMDQDDISSPHRLKIQLQELITGKYCLLGTCYQDIDHKGQTIKKIRRLCSSSDLKKSLLTNTYFCHGSLMFKKNIWQKVNGYDSRFDYAEDYDFISRIALISGCKLGNIPKILYSHRVNPLGMSLSHQHKQQTARDKISKRNFNAWENFYSPRYTKPKHNFEKKFQKEVARELTKAFLKKGLVKQSLSELLFSLA